MYEWDESLETGDNVVDNQHRLWFTVVNRVLYAFNKGRAREEIARTLEFLVIYSVNHFAAEEDLMLSHNYLEYSAHKRHHEEFKTIVRGQTRRLVKEGPSAELIDNIVHVIKDWLVNHIKLEDFRFAAHIKTKPVLESKCFTSI
ncbi:MAG: hemerythrin family protein [Treponema sp.]|nr:hemerythrin family protein [Treponema sp.]